MTRWFVIFLINFAFYVLLVSITKIVVINLVALET